MSIIENIEMAKKFLEAAQHRQRDNLKSSCLNALLVAQAYLRDARTALQTEVNEAIDEAVSEIGESEKDEARNPDDRSLEA